VTDKAWEDPCKETGVGCRWEVNDGCEELGIGWDLYCGDCYRKRDWRLAEWHPPGTAVCSACNEPADDLEDLEPDTSRPDAMRVCHECAELARHPEPDCTCLESWAGHMGVYRLIMSRRTQS
jgi:hypothetical protein